jgi:alpha-galactosidase
VSLNGEVAGVSTIQLFALRQLDPQKSYTAQVRTIWQDGRVSEKKAELKFTLNSLLPNEISLSSLNPVRITHGWRQPEMNRNFNSGGLRVAGRYFEKGIGMPTNSDVEFELNGTYDSFTSTVGIDDEFNNNDTAVEFILLGDGKELWQSGPIKKPDGAKQMKADVKNVRRLTLRVRRKGEGGRVHADWADAKLLRSL